jgi:4-amino-4-deoxy-L-arabinose transferase-like glycosyltransferase
LSAQLHGSSDKGVRSLLLLGLLTGFALRLFHLGAESLWYDETVSVHLARLPLAEMLARTAGDIHPPGYYALLHLWQRLTAPSLAHGLEFLYTWPSLAAGMLVLALLYTLGRQLFGVRTGLIALWLAAVSPFQLWYSQEVRMYTVGAALSLFTLWAALRFRDRRQPWRWLVVYTVSAAAGLYTLYYFAFWLVALTMTILALLWREKPGRGARIGAWLGAQTGVLLLFAPWLPFAMRQALEPPVPPWRTPWTSVAALASSLAETLAALWIGQTPPAAGNWPWALIVLGVMVAFGVWAWRSASPAVRTHAALLASLLLLPLLQLYTITLLATPIYHVRYVFLYAAPFLLMPAALLAALWPSRRWLASGALLGWLTVSAWAARDFWLNPLYRADDHRGAVAALAAAWRPGDAILANAGWIYPVLTTYWPQQLLGVDGFMPPGIGRFWTFVDYANANNNDADFAAPTVVRSGSVDAPATLGWGDPASDFFAISASDTTRALQAMAGSARRIWQYRLYDTVSDPGGIIRQWLGAHTALLSEAPIPGRDFGLVQLFASGAQATPLEASTDPLCFGEIACIHGYANFTEKTVAGAPFYLAQAWSFTQPPPALAVSLRLYDAAGRLAAQQDAPFTPPSATWPASTVQRQSFALPVGVSTKPGEYTLEQVVYAQESGAALSLPEDAPSIDGQRLRLGTVTVQPSPRAPELPAPVATFDYIDLIEARLDRTAAQPGETLHAAIFWRPRANSYRDTYHAVMTLADSTGATAETWRFTLGGDEYPSGAWPEGLPVRDLYDLPLPATLAPGHYTLHVALERAADGALIPARRGWWSQEQVSIGEVSIGEVGVDAP